MRGVSKTFGRQRVLDGVSLTLRRGETLGLVGENGAGKSTLVNILCGVVTGDEGEIRMAGRPIRPRSPREAEQAGLVMVHQELNLVPEMSIAENVFLGREPRTRFGLLDRRSMAERTAEVLEHLRCPRHPATPVRELGVGERQIVEIARAISRRARVLVLDEPTAALSAEETERLFAVLRELQSQGTGLLYISHRLEEIFALASAVVVLRDGVVVAEERIVDIDTPELVRAMVGRELAQLEARPELGRRESRLPVLLEVRGLWRGPSRQPGSRRRVLDDLSFEVRCGEVLGIAGLVGAGRTELLEVLFGQCKADFGGEIRLAGELYEPRDPGSARTMGLAFVTEDRRGDGLVLGQGARFNLSLCSLPELSRGGFVDTAREAELVKRLVAELDIRVSGPEQEVGTLSGGNQQKVVLAKWLATGPRLLLLDEPTRGIDVGARAEIYRLLGRLAEQGVAQILVSSDWHELVSLSDRILVLRQGREAATLERDEVSQARLLELAATRGAASPSGAVS
jgi:ribose transport system ATP-binding protein